MERDEQLVHRLEAFCDIVIGFSLAELTFGLVIPNHAIALVRDPSWILYYLFTFSIVALMWWSHYRLFRVVFYPDTLNILINFAWLATVALLTYFMQISAHAATLRDGVIGTELYFATLAINFVLNAAMTAGSYRRRGAFLDDAGKARIVRVIASALLSALLLSIGTYWAATRGPAYLSLVPLAMVVGYGGGGRLLVALWNCLRNRPKEHAREEGATTRSA